MNAGKLEREEEADEEEMEEKKVKKEVKGKVEEKVVVTEGEEGGRMVEEEEDTARGTRDGSGHHRISLSVRPTGDTTTVGTQDNGGLSVGLSKNTPKETRYPARIPDHGICIYKLVIMKVKICNEFYI